MENSVSFDLEVITPLFMAGADPAKPELRPPSIRGAMRWWFRAVAGGLIGNNIHAIKELETAVFGSQQVGSAVTVRVLNLDLNARNYNPLPHRQARFQFKGFEPQQHLIIQLGIRPGVNEFVTKRFQILQKIFTLTTLLGGTGRRSRRGFGHVQLNTLNVESSTELKQHIQDELSATRTLIQRFAEEFAQKTSLSFTLQGWNTLPTFPVLKFPLRANTDCRIAVSRKHFSHWEELLRTVGLKMRNFKGRVFGNANPRQASPIIIQVNRLTNKNYVPIFTVLKHKLIQSDNWDKVYNFIVSFDPEYVEV